MHLFNRGARRAAELDRLDALRIARPHVIGVDGAGDLITDNHAAVYTFARPQWEALADVSPAVKANDEALAREILRLCEAS